MQRRCLNYFGLVLSIVLTGKGVFAQPNPAFNFDCNTLKIRVNPENARGGSFSQFFDSIEFIPLETTKGSFFGDIWKLEIGNNYFALSDNDTRSIKIFRADGKFSGSIDIGKMQQINSEVSATDMMYIWNLALTPNDSILTTSYSKNSGLACFNMRGTFLHNISVNETGIPGSIGYLKDNKLIYSPVVMGDKKDSIKHFVSLFDVSSKPAEYKQFLKVNSNQDIPHRMDFFEDLIRCYILYNNHNASFMYYGPTLYDIYEFKEDSLLHKIHLIFPQKYTFPDEYYKMTTEKKNEFCAANHDVIYNLRSIYRLNDFLFFETMNVGGYFSSNRHFIYNLKNGDLIGLDRIETDALSSFLPFRSEFGSIAGTDGKYIYCYVSSVDMFRARENNKHNVTYSPALEKYFQESNRKSNAVIVKLKLKSNLN
jgi:hypothetical protein